MSSYFSRAKDPISSFSHLMGAAVFLFGTIGLILKGVLTSQPASLLAAAVVFGCSLILLYSASAIYHFVNSTERINLILRKLDHAMIYVLIAGSYTPILLRFYPAEKSLPLVIAIWAIACFGIAIKLLWFSAPRLLYTGLYLLMGWFILIDLSALSTMSPAAVALLAGGGVSYTTGGVIYAIKKPNISKKFSHHDFFHMFVLLGSLCHYLLVLLFVL